MFVLYQRRFENVPLVTPNGDVLVRELNFQVQNNRTWMVWVRHLGFLFLVAHVSLKALQTVAENIVIE